MPHTRYEKQICFECKGSGKVKCTKSDCTYTFPHAKDCTNCQGKRYIMVPFEEDHEPMNSSLL